MPTTYEGDTSQKEGIQYDKPRYFGTPDFGKVASELA